MDNVIETNGADEGSFSLNNPAPVEEEKPRRRVGRPRKSETATETAAAPEGDSASVMEAAEAPRNKGGRPRKVNPEDTYAQQAKGLHMFAAAAFSAPFLMINDDEAAIIGKNMANVAAEFGWENGGKIGAAFGLAMAIAMVDIPKLMMLRHHLMQRKAMREASSTVSKEEGSGGGS